MSASSEKKRRQNEREQGVEKRQLAQREAEEKAKKSKTNWTIGTVLVVLLLVVIFVLNSSLPYQMTAFSAGNETFNAAEMKYFYANAYNSMYSYLGWFGVDTSKSLADQECSMLPDGGSWQDYLRQQAQDSAKWMQAMYEEAQANGYTLSEDGQKRGGFPCFFGGDREKQQYEREKVPESRVWHRRDGKHAQGPVEQEHSRQRVCGICSEWLYLYG